MSANPRNARPGLVNSGLPNSGLPDLGLTSSAPPGETTGSPSFPLSGYASPPIFYAPGHEALQALLAFSSLHEKIRERRARERLGTRAGTADVWELEQFVLDEVLQLVSERALSLTGADGVAIALAEGNAFICRAAAGIITPEPGARLDLNSGFSGACLRTGGIVRCDDSENDRRVDVQVCRRLGTRSIVAIPIAASHATIGLLEAFSAEPYGFNDSDVRSLKLLAELILAAMKPEEENRLAEISQRLVAGEARSPNLAEAARDSTPATDGPVGEKPAIDVSPAPDVQGMEPEIALFRDIDLFRDIEKTQRFSPRLVLVVVLLLLTLAGLAARMWWTSGHRAPVSQPAPASVKPSPEAASSAVNTEANSSSNLESIHPLQQLVTGIWNVSSTNSSTVIIDLEGEVQYEAHRLSDPERIYFDLHGTALAHGLFGKTIEVGDPVLARVRIAQPRQGISRVVLETNGASDFSVSLQSKPYRLVVQIRKSAKRENSAISGAPEPDPPTPDLLSRNRQSNDLTAPNSAPPAPGRVESKSEGQLQNQVAKFRLVLDPGHGGWDLGTVGRKGLMEKDLVLDIVERLGKLVQSRLGAEVIYTRQDDTYLPLEKRTEIANLAQADMFVSVHANYSDDSTARGAETYYTNTYSSVRARTAGAESDATAENVNWNNVDIRDKVQQSRRFAVAVQQALHRALAVQIPGMRNRGVKKASYVVLTGTSMPAILAEVSFVSSPADEDILKSSSYRQNIAEGLYTGIAQYAAASHHMNLASASSKPKGL